jgi:uncharacterized protein YaeQ
MALSATVRHFEIALSDVDRNVYETLDLRVAQHPSETERRLVLRVLAYCLSYEEGIAFSKGGLSSVDEPPIAIVDPTGRMTSWIEIGLPSADRIHKASKAARVSVFTHDLGQLRKQTEGASIHKADQIDVWSLDPSFIDALAARVERRVRLEVTRTEGMLYVTIDGTTFETALVRMSLVE